MKFRRLLPAVALLAIPAAAGEYAVLSTGYRIYADRHESAGANIRLFSAAGYIEIPANTIAAFEQDDRPATPLPAAPQAPAQDPRQVVADAAKQHGANPDFIRLVQSVAKVESAFNPQAVSPKGALGLMQLMPDTAKVLGVDPKDPVQNANGGARYLSELLLKYGGRSALALAAYNAGPGAVDRYKGIPPFPETVQYIEKVLKHYQNSNK